jgi:hypothetical protein
VNAKKWVATGLSARVKMVAIIPVMVIAPNFLAHHKLRISEIAPIMSHRKGIWVSSQKIGAIVILSTAQRVAHIAMTATSRVLK